MSNPENKIVTKLAAARTKLILDHPFLGALALRLPLQEVIDQEWCKTTGTDAKHLFYNPAYIETLSPQQTQFMVAHEALHCGLSHFARRHHRKKTRWDLACDMAINPLLKDEGMHPPPGYLIIDEYRGLTAEEIYPLLGDNPESEQPDDHLYDEAESEGGSQGNSNQKPDSKNPKNKQQPAEGKPKTSDKGGAKPPPPLTHDERETLNIQWQQRMAGAAQQAMQAGKLGGSLARMIDHLLQPQLPWRSVLARYLSNNAKEDYSYMRPSRREGEFILPSLRSQQIDLVVALDTSASIKEEEFAGFVAEIDALKGQLRARISLIACDAELAEGAPWIFEPWEEFKLPEHFKGGGGTRYQPVFDWVDKQDMHPEALIYFTDGDADFPATQPFYPVLWLIKGKLPVPWGERIQLN